MYQPPHFRVEDRAALVGVIQAHLARANPQWKEIAAGAEALAIFQSVDHYITPGWYETKRETGKVVPTWNYVIVQARGPVHVDESPEWLSRQIDVLTRQQEESVGSHWQVSDAPEPFIAAQLRGIVGIEMKVESITGKFKLSQNRPESDRRGVAEGLEGLSDETSRDMASLVRAHGQIS
jgi:transcriptional regulator